MLYRELVARISEVTRTLIDRGDGGECELGSTKFHTGTLLKDPVKSGLILAILEGSAAGHYVIAEVHPEIGVLILEGNDFRTSARYVTWTIYEPGVSPEGVLKVLRMLPQVIMECDEGEQVRTDLGTFRLTRRKRKRVRDPQGRWTYSEERIVARIRPGKRLQREIEKESSEPSLLLVEDFPEDL